MNVCMYMHVTNPTEGVKKHPNKDQELLPELDLQFTLRAAIVLRSLRSSLSFLSFDFSCFHISYTLTIIQ